MAVLVAKLLLAPALIAGATIVTRRHGARLGGLIATLPAAAGPILLVIALQQGEEFAADAASGALLGVISLDAFIVVYCGLAMRVGWALAMVAGWLAFVAGTATLSSVTAAPVVELAMAFAANVVTLFALSRIERAGDGSRAGAETASDDSADPSWDIPMRAAAAVAMIVTITALADRLGPRLSGLLTPFPIIATVLAVFTHAQDGGIAAARMMRAFTGGLFAFAMFFFTLLVTLRVYGTATAFSLALVATLATQAVTFVVGGRVARATGGA
ncbi:MAG: hypothetical protein HY827_02990 [Actinobacteria bacterium]|nr:hypothetical protein [Actinomycetota bacterium]